MTHSGFSYMTPQAFTEQNSAQLRKALPHLADLPIFTSRMNAAKAMGLNWNESFEYALGQCLAIAALRTRLCAGGPHGGFDDADPSADTAADPSADTAALDAEWMDAVQSSRAAVADLAAPTAPGLTDYGLVVPTDGAYTAVPT